MSNNDIIANALSKIDNAERIGRHEIVAHPASALLRSILTIMNEHNYIGIFEESKDSRGSRLVVPLLGKINRCGAIKPRYVVKKDALETYEKSFLPAKGFGILIVSTSKGVMTSEQAKEKSMGGKLIAYCY